MDHYLVNRNAQPTSRREHEVHRVGGSCQRLPAPENRVDLGPHPTCRNALAAAEQKGYKPADGCAYCVPDCHTT